MTRGQNFFSKTITLTAGQESEVFAGLFSTIIIISSTATDYTTDIALKIGKMGFKTLPTGVEFSPAGEPFGNFQLKNTGGVSHTVHVLAALGSIRNYNLQLNGDVSIDTVTIDDTTPIKTDDDATQTLLTALDAVVDTISTAVAAIQTAAESIDTKLTTIDAVLDQIEVNTSP
jgi:hypothetical protein